MSIETRMAIAQSTPMPHRSENGVTVRYEAKVFSLSDRKASAEVAHAYMYPIAWIPAFADIGRPGMSGLDLQTKLNADHCPIPIIFITAHGDKKMRLQAMRGGAVKSLAKSFDDAILAETVRTTLKR
jgi:DNA-binding NarL/FixJ family response regulator